ncbi:DUF6966 domain-containing protein [Nonomuraea rubra]|uniref:DUF6966 domain-containing protein n=1 Tax=Nonomuraea rubra TaxID=46180 RepID=A0A7X0P1I4_9ACTN|nr:hypothetical protein [Nonomuraea rubra]MBB6553540.1 hypothetical protein [Nonomuraea rubra]
MQKPVGVIQARIDKALPPVWDDGKECLVTTGYAVKIPSGVPVFEGEVANQGSWYMGGTDQIYIRDLEHPRSRGAGLMAASLEEDRLHTVLLALIELLDRVGETGWADALRRHLLEVEEARDRDSPELLQYAVRRILRLSGGMGSFADLVLMRDRKVLPEQNEFHSLRRQLFEVAWDELR